MESDEHEDLIREGPLLIHSNDRREYFVEKPEFIVVGDYSAAILVHDNGVRRINHIALRNIASVVPYATPPKHQQRPRCRKKS
jgi:hypothetical protein